jgi:hypothetical protein
MIDKLVTAYGRNINQQIGIGTAGAFASESRKGSKFCVRNQSMLHISRKIMETTPSQETSCGFINVQSCVHKVVIIQVGMQMPLGHTALISSPMHANYNAYMAWSKVQFDVSIEY